MKNKRESLKSRLTEGEHNVLSRTGAKLIALRAAKCHAQSAMRH